MERAFKYHGLGNDFVILDRRAQGQDISARDAIALCDRHRGIGADGILVLLPQPEAAARMVVHNSDGSVAEMCGNGIRCAVKYLVERSADRPEQLKIATGAGVLSCAVRYEQSVVKDVQVAMGPVRWPQVPLPLSGFEDVQGVAVNIGNPHWVIFDRPFEEAATLGPKLERHPVFPQRTNVEWARLDGGDFATVVWERGAGLTLACGTGACAVAASAVKSSRAAADTWIRVRLPGGLLEVRVTADFSSVQMRGPARFVFETVVPDVGDA
jgi:diaminopimelate epimerase